MWQHRPIENSNISNISPISAKRRVVNNEEDTSNSNIVGVNDYEYYLKQKERRIRETLSPQEIKHIRDRKLIEIRDKLDEEASRYQEISKYVEPGSKHAIHQSPPSNRIGGMAALLRKLKDKEINTKNNRIILERSMTSKSKEAGPESAEDLDMEGGIYSGSRREMQDNTLTRLIQYEDNSSLSYRADPHEESPPTQELSPNIRIRDIEYRDKEKGGENMNIYRVTPQVNSKSPNPKSQIPPANNKNIHTLLCSHSIPVLPKVNAVSIMRETITSSIKKCEKEKERGDKNTGGTYMVIQGDKHFYKGGSQHNDERANFLVTQHEGIEGSHRYRECSFQPYVSHRSKYLGDKRIRDLSSDVELQHSNSSMTTTRPKCFSANSSARHLEYGVGSHLNTKNIEDYMKPDIINSRYLPVDSGRLSPVPSNSQLWITSIQSASGAHRIKLSIELIEQLLETIIRRLDAQEQGGLNYRGLTNLFEELGIFTCQHLLLGGGSSSRVFPQAGHILKQIDAEVLFLQQFWIRFNPRNLDLMENGVIYDALLVLMSTLDLPTKTTTRMLTEYVEKNEWSYPTGIWSIRKLVGEFGLIVKESLLGGKEGNNSTRQSNFGTPKALNYVEEDHFKDESPQQLKSKSASKPPLNSNKNHKYSSTKKPQAKYMNRTDPNAKLQMELNIQKDRERDGNMQSHYEKYWESNREPEPRGHNYKPEINDRNPNQRTHPPNDYPRANQMNDYEEYEIKRTPIGLSPADRYKLMFLKQTEEQEQIDIIRRKQIRKDLIAEEAERPNEFLPLNSPNAQKLTLAKEQALTQRLSERKPPRFTLKWTDFQSKEVKEEEECTFKPDLISKNSARPSSHIPKGYHENILRMRKGFDLKLKHTEDLNRVSKGERLEELRRMKPQIPRMLRKSEKKRNVLIYVDINISPGRTGRIAISEGDDINQIASNFAKTFQLQKGVRDKLKGLLESCLVQYFQQLVTIYNKQQIPADDDYEHPQQYCQAELYLDA